MPVSTVVQMGFTCGATSANLRGSCLKVSSPFVSSGFRYFSFKLPIDTAFKLVVKFGSVENDYDDEILILPHGSHEIQLQKGWFFFKNQTNLSVSVLKI